MRITNGTLIRVMLVRLAEMFISCAVLSSILTAIDQFTSLGDSFVFVAIAVALAIAFVGVNVYLGRQCCVELLGYARYYITNISAYAVFAVVSTVLWSIIPATNWLFKILTVFMISFQPSLSMRFCISTYHAIMILILLITPFGLKEAIEAMRKELMDNGLEE